jgi:BirA family biotin operon repressor/biotin-[acetyl-CoA-carboxylase] ligase
MHFVPECHSTNSLALELCQHSCPLEGTVVITDRQTSGRGQQGNRWESEPQMNLTFSVILKPTFLAIKEQFLLSVLTSLAVRDSLIQLTKRTVDIKWPNDILVNEFKICGILIENQLAGDQITNSVIGIGLNINQTKFASTEATSLSLITGSSHDLQVVLHKILSALEARYLALRQNKVQKLWDDYHAHLYRRNQSSTFMTGEEQFEGTIIGVDEQGKLLISVGSVIRAFNNKEITIANRVKTPAS